jgi:DNA invertase Pin-like site-specific DNA recombinase
MMAVAELEAGMISAAALVVAKVDRLARSQNFLSRILEAGVEVRFSRQSLRG